MSSDKEKDTQLKGAKDLQENTSGTQHKTMPVDGPSKDRVPPDDRLGSSPPDPHDPHK